MEGHLVQVALLEEWDHRRQMLQAWTKLDLQDRLNLVHTALDYP